MATTSYEAAKSAYTRVFLIKGRAAPDHRPEYQSSMRAGSFEQSFGDIERIEIPSSEQYGQFEEIDEIQGAIERASSSLVGQYAADLASTLFAYAKQRCPIDVHVNFGECTDPRDNNRFTKKLIWQNVHLPSYSTDDLGALTSDENATITETSDLSIAEQLEILQLTIQERAPDLITNQVVDAVICDRRSCGNCDDYSEGCDKAFALQGGILGSPGTAPDVLYTEDAGANWGIDEINALISTQTADALACLGDYVVVVSNDAGSLSYKEKTDILDAVAGGWSEVTTGFVTGGEPNDIWSVGVGAYIVGDGGYVYWLEEPSAGVEVLDAGVATAQNLNAVHGLDDENAVAVGQSDTIIYTTNRVTWSAATATGGGGNLQAVWMMSDQEWWVVDDAGSLYYTKDQGVSWTTKSLPGAGISALYDIQFQEDNVGYVAGVANSAGAIWRTYDGGYSWVRLPEGVGSLVGSTTQINALAACTEDPNFLIAVGQKSGDDGAILVGID